MQDWASSSRTTTSSRICVERRGPRGTSRVRSRRRQPFRRDVLRPCHAGALNLGWKLRSLEGGRSPHLIDPLASRKARTGERLPPTAKRIQKGYGIEPDHNFAILRTQVFAFSSKFLAEALPLELASSSVASRKLDRKSTSKWAGRSERVDMLLRPLRCSSSRRAVRQAIGLSPVSAIAPLPYAPKEAPDPRPDHYFLRLRRSRIPRCRYS